MPVITVCDLPYQTRVEIKDLSEKVHGETLQNSIVLTSVVWCQYTATYFPRLVEFLQNISVLLNNVLIVWKLFLIIRYHATENITWLQLTFVIGWWKIVTQQCIYYHPILLDKLGMLADNHYTPKIKQVFSTHVKIKAYFIVRWGKG